MRRVCSDTSSFLCVVLHHSSRFCFFFFFSSRRRHTRCSRDWSSDVCSSDLAATVAAVERGFRALALGEATLPDPLVMELAELSGEVHVKSAYLRGARHIVLKLATGFYGNRERGLPSGDGLFLLLDAQTGVPELLLEEHGYLTDLRTAAAVALALRD